MELNLKGLGKKDMEFFEEIPKERKKIIHSSSSSAILTKFNSNELASILHPKVQHVSVIDIIEENDSTKTFVLAPNAEKNTKKLAYFRPGQYISVEVEIDGCIYHRPYTISCSPKNVFDNLYTITIKRKRNGIVSNFFLDEVKVGDHFSISAPMGNFYYEPLRDANNVIALVGGSGITPILSMAEAIKDGILDFKLTILYGARTKKDLLFHKELDELAKKSNLINVEYILSEEQKEGYLSGFITKEMIDKYRENETSFFVCGPINMYEYVNDLLKDYQLPNKYIRHDAFFGRVDISKNEDYELTILTAEKKVTIVCHSKETLLNTMEKNSVLIQSRCQVGNCGFCRSKLKSGMIRTIDGCLRKADEKNKYIHPCISFPESDIVIELPY